MNNINDLLLKTDVNSLSEIIGYLSVKCHQGKFEEINTLINQLDFSKLDEVVVVTLIRTLSAAKIKLPSWNTWLNDAAKAFSNKGLDSVRMLHGLKLNNF